MPFKNKEMRFMAVLTSTSPYQQNITKSRLTIRGISNRLVTSLDLEISFENFGVSRDTLFWHRNEHRIINIISLIRSLLAVSYNTYETDWNFPSHDLTECICYLSINLSCQIFSFNFRVSVQQKRCLSQIQTKESIFY